jgi:hypothetical protein
MSQIQSGQRAPWKLSQTTVFKRAKINAEKPQALDQGRYLGFSRSVVTSVAG